MPKKTTGTKTTSTKKKTGTKKTTNKTHMAVTAEHVVDDLELAALEAALDAELEDVELEEEINVEGADEDTIVEAVEEVEMEEAKADAYEEQDAASEIEIEPAPVVAEKPKTPRKTMTGHKKSEVALSKVGEKATGFILEVADAELDADAQKEKFDKMIAGIDELAIKVGEKAVNLVAYAANDAKLSTYTQISMAYLVSKGTVTAKELIEHLQDQDANGVKSYGIGTARSQAHQMFKLFPEFKIATMDGKAMTVNEDSLIVAKFKAAK